MEPLPLRSETQTKSLPLLSIAAILIALVSFLSYWEVATKADFFVLDDIPNIQENLSIRITELTPETLINAAHVQPHLATRRPIPYLTFGINYYFDRLDPSAYRMTNVAILALAGIGVLLLAYLLTRRWTDDDIAMSTAIIAAALWTFSPLQINQTTYIVQRMTSLAILGFSWSFVFFILGEQRSKYYWIPSAMMAVIAILSKEIAYLLPASIFLYKCAFDEEWEKAIVAPKWPIALIVSVGALLLYAVSALSGYYSQYDFTMWERLLTQGRVLWDYLSLYVLPLPSRLALDHDVVTSTGIFSPYTTALSFIAHFAAIGTAVYLWRRQRFISLLIFLYYLLHLMESSTIGLDMAFEHRMLLPAIFLSILIGYLVSIGLKSAVKKHSLALALGIAISVFAAATLASMTVQYNKHWLSPVAFWEDLSIKSPKNSRVWLSLSAQYILADRDEDARRALESLLVLEPDNLKGLVNLGVSYMAQGDYRRALGYLNKATDSGFVHHELFYNVGICYDVLGMFNEAVASYQKAINAFPGIMDARMNIASLYMKVGRKDLALQYLREELAYNPHNNEARALLMRLSAK